MTAQVDLRTESTGPSRKNRSNVVIWLTALDEARAAQLVSAPDPDLHPRLVQKNKRFTPHVVVVPVGTAVEFPNRDPFFHNVFSLFEGKRFDLGLYEAGTTRLVHFDRPGVSYIFCNIHPEMSGVVIALKSPYFGISSSAGKISIPHVPPGRYLMQVWAEGTSPESLKGLSREISVSSIEYSLGEVRVAEDAPPGPHKNLYGREYDAPGSDYPRADPR